MKSAPEQLIRDTYAKLKAGDVDGARRTLGGWRTPRAAYFDTTDPAYCTEDGQRARLSVFAQRAIQEVFENRSKDPLTQYALARRAGELLGDPDPGAVLCPIRQLTLGRNYTEIRVPMQAAFDEVLADLKDRAQASTRAPVEAEADKLIASRRRQEASQIAADCRARKEAPPAHPKIAALAVAEEAIAAGCRRLGY